MWISLRFKSIVNQYRFTSGDRGTYALSREKRLLRRVCPSVRLYHRGCRWTDFREILYFKNPVRKIRIWLKSDKNMGLLT